MAARFKKKPIIIEAVRWDGSNNKEISDFCVDRFAFYEDKLLIGTLEGVMEAGAGDWIIRGVKGELYPIKDNIFKMTYEEVIENG